MLWYFPLEHLDIRYTRLMDAQITRALEARGVAFTRIRGRQINSEIETGAFLDSEATTIFKASQLEEIAWAFRKGQVRDGDRFYFSDLWFPGLEAVPYMAMFRGINNLEIWGSLHAGSWTETDYVAKLKHWAADLERGWFKLITGAFLGSEFCKRELLAKERSYNDAKFHVTGHPFSTADVLGLAGDLPPKENLVVFAGRLDDEKQPWEFERLAEALRDRAQFVRTYDLKLSKPEYFRLLARAKVVFSAALQENFGYAMLEAATLGATPVVPNRLAYPEIWPEACLYNSFEEAVEKTARFLEEPLNLKHVAARYDGAVDAMLRIMLL